MREVIAIGLRDKVKRLERAAEGEMVTLHCRECGEELRVAEVTDLALLAHAWVQGSGGESYQPTPPDVFVITGHRCGWESLVVKGTGKPWPLMDIVIRTSSDTAGIVAAVRGKVRDLDPKLPLSNCTHGSNGRCACCQMHKSQSSRRPL